MVGRFLNILYRNFFFHCLSFSQPTASFLSSFFSLFFKIYPHIPHSSPDPFFDLFNHFSPFHTFLLFSCSYVTFHLLPLSICHFHYFLFFTPKFSLFFFYCLSDFYWKWNKQLKKQKTSVFKIQFLNKILILVEKNFSFIHLI